MSRAGSTLKRYSCPLHPYDHDRSCCPEMGIQTTTPAKGGRKDLWNYEHRFNQKDRVQIRSKRHFKQECSKRGLIQVTRDDLLKNGKAYHPDPPPINRDSIAEKLAPVAKRAASLIKQGAFRE